MKIDLTRKFVDLDGKEIKIRTGKDTEEVATLAFIAANALLSETEGERLSGIEKVKNFDLAVGIYKAKEVDLTAEDIVRIKGRIEKTYGTLIVGQADKMLEGKK